MSVARLLISGLLMASGLVLAAFTMHGAFDARQVQASGPGSKAWSADTFGVAGRRVTQEGPKTTAGVSLKTNAPPSGATTEAKAAADAKAAAAKAKRKRLAEKRAAEKKLAEKRALDKKLAEEAKARQKPQQTALQWPWNWFK